MNDQKAVLTPMDGRFGVESVPVGSLEPVEHSYWGTDDCEAANLAAGTLQILDSGHLYQASAIRPLPQQIETE